MAKAKVKRDFTGLEPNDKVAFGRNRIVVSMDANPSFPAMDPTVADLNTACDTLETTYNNFKNGGVGTKALFEAAELEWNEAFEDEADYVDEVADGSTVIITSGGWDYTDVEPTKRPAAGAISDLSAMQNIQPGTIDITSEKADFADSYITIISPTAEIAAQIQIIGEQLIIRGGGALIIIRPSSRTSIQITNLDSGQRYYIFRFARNTTGRGPNSQTITIIAP